MQGEVSLIFIITHEGLVRDIFAESYTHPDFALAAIRAYKGMQFKPGTRDGQPVNVRIRQQVPFSFEGSNPTFERYFSPEQCDKAPMRIDESLPSYPAELSNEYLKGSVEVDFSVGPDGQVAEIVFAQSDHPLFSQAVEIFLRQTRFTPAVRDDRPVGAWVNATYSFSPPATPAAE